MDKFVIITDSCSDLTKELREKYDIDYVAMHYTYDDKDVIASLDWEYLPCTDFYNLMRNGVRIKTTQVPSVDYEQKFEFYLEKGYDILSISCSSALSASFFASEKVRDQLIVKYPERKILCVDALNSCIGQGILCMWASVLRSEGKTIDEVYALIEANKLKVNQFATVEDLTYLKRAGRVKAAAAFFGGLMQVKPIIISDAIGQNFACEKVKGRSASISRIIELFGRDYDRRADFNEVWIAHADDEKTANDIKVALTEKLGDKVAINISVIGPIVGASVGPGTVSIYGFGNEVTVNKIN